MAKGKIRLVVLSVVTGNINLEDGSCAKEETNIHTAQIILTTCFMIFKFLKWKNYCWSSFKRTLYPAFTITFTSFTFLLIRFLAAPIPAVAAWALRDGSIVLSS